MGRAAKRKASNRRKKEMPVLDKREVIQEDISEEQVFSDQQQVIPPEGIWWTRLSSPKKCRWKDTPFSISMTM